MATNVFKLEAFLRWPFKFFTNIAKVSLSQLSTLEKNFDKWVSFYFDKLLIPIKKIADKGHKL